MAPCRIRIRANAQRMRTPVLDRGLRSQNAFKARAKGTASAPLRGVVSADAGRWRRWGAKKRREDAGGPGTSTPMEPRKAFCADIAFLVVLPLGCAPPGTAGVPPARMSSGLQTLKRRVPGLAGVSSFLCRKTPARRRRSQDKHTLVRSQCEAGHVPPAPLLPPPLGCAPPGTAGAFFATLRPGGREQSLS